MEADSRAAITIAAGPPYMRKVRKTAASEKLIANRDLGSVRLIRGVITTEHARITKKPQLSCAFGRSESARAKATVAARITIPLKVFERGSLFIKGGIYENSTAQ